MKQLDLITWERQQIILCVPERGSPANFRAYVRILDVAELTSEEKDEVGWTETQMLRDRQQLVNARTGLPIVNVTVEKPEHIFELSFEDADYKVLMQLAEARDTWAIRGPEKERVRVLLDKLETAREK